MIIHHKTPRYTAYPEAPTPPSTQPQTTAASRNPKPQQQKPAPQSPAQPTNDTPTGDTPQATHHSPPRSITPRHPRPPLPPRRRPRQHSRHPYIPNPPHPTIHLPHIPISRRTLLRLNPPHRLQPPRSPRQRHPNEPTPTLNSPPPQRDQHPIGRQPPRPMIKRLRRQRNRHPVPPPSNPRRHLHQTVKPPPSTPRPRMPIRGQRHKHSPLWSVTHPKPLGSQRTGPIRLNHDVSRVPKGPKPPRISPQIQMRTALAEPSINQSRPHHRKVRRTHVQHRSPMRGKGPPTDRPRDHMGQLQNPDPRQRPFGGSKRTRRPVTDPFHSNEWLQCDSPPLRVISPFIRRTQRRGGASSGEHRLRSLHRRPPRHITRVPQHRPRGRLVMGVVAVQPQPPVTRAVVAREWRPQVSHRRAVDQQVPLTAERLDRVLEVDRHLTGIGPPVAQQVRRGRGDHADALAREVGDAVRARHDPLVAREPHGRFATSSAGTTRVPV